MDSPNTEHTLESTYRLLALCARAEGHPAFYRELKKQARAFKAWDDLPAQAEAQGMSGLVWHHLQAAKIKIPGKTQQVFKGLSLRERVYQRIHAQALVELIALLDKKKIHPLVLKGLALAYGYYPEPALRPVSDIDLYFQKKDFLRAARTLKKAGYNVHLPPAIEKRLPKSLTADTVSKEGINIHIELHQYDPQGGHEKGNIADIEFADLHEKPQKISINGVSILAPGVNDMLLFLSKHFAKHLFTGSPHDPAQLKWVADIISLVERHASEIDWGSLQQDHPDLIGRLELFYSLTPIPVHLANMIPVQRVYMPAALGQYPPGWPHQKISEWKHVGLPKFLYLAFFFSPAEWWTRLYYGISTGNIFWHRHLIYRKDVFKAASRTLLFYLQNKF
jgi:hypothetical protein